jgi:hypothetical protein
MSAASSTDPMLEIERDFGFEQHQLRVQRWARALMALVVLTGLLGAFGDGVLSGAAVNSAEVQLSYQRLARRTVALEFQFQLSRATTALELRVPNSILERAQVRSLEPAPRQSVTTTTEHIWRFAALPDGAEVRLEVEPHALGLYDGEIRLEDTRWQATLPVSYWVYP